MDDALDFRRTTVTQLAGMVSRAEVSARELTQLALDRIEALNPTINAFVAVDGERALEQAAAVDQLVATGADPGPLAGVPIGVKDLEDAAGFRTTKGSPLYADAAPALADSMLVARLRAAGCVVVGKTNTPEFGWAAKTDNALFGPTRNPWQTDHGPGGSSGGSAAALAAGMVPLATGSDGGGSIRIPSSCCGLSGMKPSLGRVPTGGPHPPEWLDLSSKGPMARRIADIVHALDVAVGPEPTDLRALPRPEASWPAVLDDPHVPARVAWSPTLGYAVVDREVLEICERAVGVLESLGAEVVQVDTVFEEDPVGPWLTIVTACLLRSHRRFEDDEAFARVDPGLVALMDPARTAGAVDVVEALDAGHRLNLRLVELFHDVRLLVTPTLAAPPPPLELGGAGLLNGEVDVNWVRFTYPFNLTRSPAATVCAGLTASGLPVGLQLVGPQHGDLVVLRSAAALEAALGFDALAPC
ncbi:MAG TPA: amidase family protein [Acidimicrobiales bacterium]|nr:amidase family protein [Acidimicrobiales bacterium]